MEKYGDYYLLNPGDFGTPRFTSMRRKLCHMQSVADIILEKLMEDFGIPEIRKPDFQIKYMVNSLEIIHRDKTVAGFEQSSIEKNTQILKKSAIYISWYHAENLFEKTVENTIPHEVCHTIHSMVDLETKCKDSHGIEFQYFLERARKLSLGNPQLSFDLNLDEFVALKSSSIVWKAL